MENDMFVIELTFLTGRYVASSFNNRKQPEWPPHPARLFSALVSEYAEAGFCSQELAVLKWLESLDAPEIHASPAAMRKVTGIFVPVNDTRIFTLSEVKKTERLTTAIAKLSNSDTESTKLAQFNEQLATTLSKTSFSQAKLDKACQLLPENRKRQLRFFPSYTPQSPFVAFLWHAECSLEQVKILDTLLSRITRLGHSSSLVSCRISNNRVQANYKPRGPAENSIPIRVIQKGQVEVLAKQFDRHKGIEPRVLAYSIVDYVNSDRKRALPNKHTRSNLAGECIFFEFTPSARIYPCTRSHEIAKVMRNSVLRHVEDPIPEEICGHKNNGSPTDKPHLVIQPIPFVGHKFADGRILGIALVIPNSMSKLAKRKLYRAIGKWESSIDNHQLKLYLKVHQSITLQRLVDNSKSTLKSLHPKSTLKSLHLDTWSRHSRTWVSATPIALPRHPGRLFHGTPASRKKAWHNAEEAVILSCCHVRLPKPVCVSVSSEPFLSGSRPARVYPSLIYHKGGKKSVTRQLIHAKLKFQNPVEGPLILGSGRFLGLGLMRPVKENGR